MINSYQLNGVDSKSLFNLLKDLVQNGNPFIIRNSINDQFDQNKLFEHLSKIPSLSVDRRHFNLDSNLETLDWWEITNIQSENQSYAHSTGIQPFHTDNAWFSDPAQINCFYMQKQAKEGGDQLILHLRDLIFLI